MTAIKVNAGDAMHKITLDVRIVGQKRLKVRLWLAAQIMKFAGFVAGCGVAVEYSREFDELPPLPRTRSYKMLGDIELPRQASVREGSPLYSSSVWEWGQKVDFYLDGEKQDEVISYDLDAGYIRVLKHGPDGKAFVNGDEIATEIRVGTIEPRLNDKK